MPGRYGVTDLARSEWTKLRSVRSSLWSSVLVVALGVGLSILATTETRAHWAHTTHPTFDPTRLSLIGVNVAQLVIGVLGVLVISGEYGTGTIRATFSAAPRRPLVIVAKVAVFTLAAVVLSEVTAFASFFLGQAMLTAPAPHATLATPGALRAVIGSGLYVCVIGLVALALGLIIRHTAGAIAAFVGVLLIFPIVVQALPQSLINAVQRYEPLHIGQIMATVRTVALASRIASSHPTITRVLPTGRHIVKHLAAIAPPPTFTPWVGFGVLCAYAAALLAIGTLLLVRRDA
jgi:ABC-type transport system involved in multi-copper enzyme maturation permease subunit